MKLIIYDTAKCHASVNRLLQGVARRSGSSAPLKENRLLLAIGEKRDVSVSMP